MVYVWRLEDNLVESALSFYFYVSSGDSTQVTCISQRSQRNRRNGMDDYLLYIKEFIKSASVKIVAFIS